MNGTEIGILMIFAAIIIFAIQYSIGRPKYDLKRKQELSDKLAPYQANCILYCAFIYGIEQIIENTPCCIYANAEKIIIVTEEQHPKTINLDLSKVQIFQKFNRDDMVPHMVGLAIREQKLTSHFIIIRYLSNNKHKEILLSLDVPVMKRIDNKYYLSQCNIFDFVNARLPEQETTIDL